MKATIAEGGLTICGRVVREGEAVEVVRLFKTTSGKRVASVIREDGSFLSFVCVSKIRIEEV
jgi:acyl-coenzyme A thioesterase PaaI-like protein